ncbi:hypothetical protein HYU23_02855 [Candidatus Woesearchaeota archaeon]|nr:hypothetical protein [Candidatus Woesearchaeota archaeon]
MFKEDENRSFKELAILLAIRNNVALIDKELEVYVVKPNGVMELISKSENPEKVWEDALRALKRTYNKRLFNYY